MTAKIGPKNNQYSGEHTSGLMGWVNRVSSFPVLLIVIGVSIALTYVLGHPILDGGLQGNDSPLHLGYAVWLNRYFPEIPHWFPDQGAGVSLLHGYQILPHYLVVIAHRLLPITIIQSYRLLSFVALPITAVGIYLFGWLALQKKIVGFIAMVLYLMAPVTWTWISDWGFFGQHFGMIFLPLALLAFDMTLDSYSGTHPGRNRRLLFFGLVVIFVLASLSHILIGAAAGIAMAVYLLFRSIIAEKGSRLISLSLGMKILAGLLLIAGMIAAMYFVPFYAYSSEANRGGPNVPAPHQINELPVPEFFGVAPEDPDDTMTRMQFPMTTVLLAFMGIVFVFGSKSMDMKFRRKGKALALLGVVATVYAVIPALPRFLLAASPELFFLINFRSLLIVAMVVLPLLAAIGAWGIGRKIVDIKSLVKGASNQSVRNGATYGAFGSILVSVIALAIAFTGLYLLGKSASIQPKVLPYGPRRPGLSLFDVWEGSRRELEADIFAQLAPQEWPPPSIKDNDQSISTSIDLANKLPTERPLRIDISPYLGRWAMDLATYANASQINTYTFQLSLFHNAWGYQQGAFYSLERQFNQLDDASILNEVSDWYGTSYVFLHPEKDPIDVYKLAGWDLHFEGQGLQIWQNPNSAGMVSLSNKPAILVIGKPETGAYESIFRLATQGLITYEQAFIAEGSANVDDYQLQEIQAFDALVLYGHDYRNIQKAWELLDAYVKAGGNLYIDTGWEFSIPEWEFAEAPAVLPIARSTWTDYGKTGDYELNSNGIVSDVDIGLFKPLIWEGQPWTLSGTNLADIRDWGNVVLSAEGRPLVVAGEYGEGRVVWSGMNLIAHSQYLGTNSEEVKLIGKLLSWLIDERVADTEGIALPTRSNPDEVSLSVSNLSGPTSWLYWREAFYRNWHAYRVEGDSRHELPIFRAGPGFMLVPIQSDTSSSEITLEWEPSIFEKIAVPISLLGTILLFAILIDGLLFSANGLTWIKVGLLARIPSPFLGKGANHEWAETKRVEIKVENPDDQVGELPIEGRIPALQSAMIQDELDLVDDKLIDMGESVHEDKVDLSGEAEKLLESWLENSSHHEDEWAQNLFTRKTERDQ